MDDRMGVTRTVARDGGKLVGKDIQVDLPEITPMTTDVNLAGGTVSLPFSGLYESMEATLYPKSADGDSAQLYAPGMHKIEIRWLEDASDINGNVKPKGSRVYWEGPQKGGARGSVNKGEQRELTAVYECLLYQEWDENGNEKFFLDKRTGKLRVNGVEYDLGTTFLGI